MAYYSSKDKDAVRDHFESPLVRRLKQRKRARLSYFGLPGEEAQDILAWGDWLTYVAAVEMVSARLQKLERLLDTRFPHIQRTTHLGQVDDVILNDSGNLRLIHGQVHRPRVSRFDAKTKISAWHFDIINLDLFGPFLPKSLGRSKGRRRRARIRTSALKHLFDRERLDSWRQWLLLITVEAELNRESEHEHQNYLEASKGSSSQEAVDALNFLLTRASDVTETAARLIVGTAATLFSAAATNAGLSARPRGAVLYSGADEQPMLHLAYHFVPAGGVLPQPVDKLDLLRMPLLHTRDPLEHPWFQLSPDQVPGLTENAARSCLDFLPAKTLEAITSG